MSIECSRSAEGSNPPIEAVEPSTCRATSAQQVLDRGRGGVRRHASEGGALITWRTSIPMFSGLPPGPGAAEAWAAIW